MKLASSLNVPLQNIPAGGFRGRFLKSLIPENLRIAANDANPAALATAEANTSIDKQMKAITLKRP